MTIENFSFSPSKLTVKAGTYYYECTIHASMASMHAQVVVE